jgi:hypothetical protein
MPFAQQPETSPIENLPIHSFTKAQTPSFDFQYQEARASMSQLAIDENDRLIH